jgi:hypothetical protein
MKERREMTWVRSRIVVTAANPPIPVAARLFSMEGLPPPDLFRGSRLRPMHPDIHEKHRQMSAFAAAIGRSAAEC